jgi:uncharacterized protein
VGFEKLVSTLGDGELVYYMDPKSPQPKEDSGIGTMQPPTNLSPPIFDPKSNAARYMRAQNGRLIEYSPTRLLVMQSTPFCNIDCKYCYLPDRQDSRRMRLETVEAVYQDLITAPFVGSEFTTVWHAGEPLTATIRFYEDAINSSRRLEGRGCKVSHSIQTNATLISDAWCEFFKHSNVHIGVSLDGPADLHDRNRRTRGGKGTHSSVMRGISLLQRHGIEFHVICVLTRHSLDHPDALFSFFDSQGIQRLGLNMEEIEGANRVSSMAASDTAQALRRCLTRLHELAAKKGMVIREFNSLRHFIYSGRSGRVNTQSLPFGIVSVDVAGNFSTFSPELLTMHHLRYGGFAFGNIHRERILSMLDSAHFQRVHHDIDSGISRCRSTCEYFCLCGGGAPSNKVFENSTFDSGQTLYCRLAKKTVIDVVLPFIEAELRIAKEEDDAVAAS